MIKIDSNPKTESSKYVPTETEPSLVFYDYETFSLDVQTGKVAQFAAIRTDMNLNIVDEPTNIYCIPSEDFLPSPIACSITGITPRIAKEKGISEVKFIRKINKIFSTHNTCSLGFNSIRFDDEVTRNLLYRNFMPPYDREWKNGNSRWDIINLARACKVLRPEGIKWPIDKEGNKRLNLDKLTKENNIEHAGAHDALSDVMATLELTRLIKKLQPKLFQLMLKNRTKQAVESLIFNESKTKKQPLIYLSPFLNQDIAIVYPIATHAENKNSQIFVDLLGDLSVIKDLIKEGEGALAASLFKKEGSDKKRPPLVEIKINQAPVLLPFSGLRDCDAKRLSINKQECLDKIKRLDFSFSDKLSISSAFLSNFNSEEKDPERQLYSGGFFNNLDLREIEKVSTSTLEELKNKNFNFRDSRLAELLVRYKGRNFPETLNDKEQGVWDDYKEKRIRNEEASFFEDLLALKKEDKITQEIYDELYNEGTRRVLEATARSIDWDATPR